MTTPRLRDALAVARINRIKQRVVAAHRAAVAARVEDRLAIAALAAAAEGIQMLRAVCDCAKCQLMRAQLADEAEAAPTTEAKH
jgi:hypothetical protein